MVSEGVSTLHALVPDQVQAVVNEHLPGLPTLRTNVKGVETVDSEVVDALGGHAAPVVQSGHRSRGRAPESAAGAGGLLSGRRSAPRSAPGTWSNPGLTERSHRWYCWLAQQPLP